MNGISQLTQVFPEDLLKNVSDYIDQVPWKYGWASNRSFEFTHWNHSFAKGNAENGLDISDNLPEPILRAWNHLKVNYLGDQTLLRCYTNSHTYGVEGYPHADSKRDVDYTIVIYMNQTSVVSGNLLSGRVYLAIHQNTVDCSSLEIWISGVETTIVHYSETTGSGKHKTTHHRTARGSSRFLDLRCSLADYQQDKQASCLIGYYMNCCAKP